MKDRQSYKTSSHKNYILKIIHSCKRGHSTSGFFRSGRPFSHERISPLRKLPHGLAFNGVLWARSHGPDFSVAVVLPLREPHTAVVPARPQRQKSRSAELVVMCCYGRFHTCVFFPLRQLPHTDDKNDRCGFCRNIILSLHSNIVIKSVRIFIEIIVMKNMKIFQCI